MQLVYLNQDGAAPSGISTYGFHVLAACPDAHMLLLNADRPPRAAPREVSDRVVCVPEAESHSVAAVAGHLGNLTSRTGGEIVVLPNTGDTPWSATVEWLRGLSPAQRACVRVLGILHSDVETQFASAQRHRAVAPVWTAVSRRCAVELRRRLSGSGASVHELHLPMPLPARKSDGNRDEPLRLVYVGRLEEPQKRISRLAMVLDALAKRGTRFRATLVGDGPAAAEFTAAIRRGQTASNVQLPGALDRADIAALLVRSDVFLLTSAYEGLPLALLEAMAAGVCPVVMHTESGISDVLVTGENAVVVSQGDTEAMVEAVVMLDHDREKLERLKRAARERIARDFAPARHFARLAEIVDECWENPPPDPAGMDADPTAQAVRDLVARAQAAAKPVVVYGAGMFGRKIVDACLDAGVLVEAWFDSDPARHGQLYRGLVCSEPTKIAGHADATCLIGSLEFAGEIRERIRATVSAAGLSSPAILTAPGARLA